MDNLHDLNVILSSRVPLVVVETHDEDRFLGLLGDIVRGAFGGTPRPLFRWSVTEGLRRIAARVHRLTAALARGLERLGRRLADGPYFDTLRVEMESPAERDRVAQSARERNLREVGRVAELHLASTNPMEVGAHLDDVTSAMQQLSEEHRAVLMLICVEGLSYKEAAEVLGVPTGTVTSRLVRARSALMKRLDNGHADGMLGAGR